MTNETKISLVIFWKSPIYPSFFTPLLNSDIPRKTLLLLLQTFFVVSQNFHNRQMSWFKLLFAVRSIWIPYTVCTHATQKYTHILNKPDNL